MACLPLLAVAFTHDPTAVSLVTATLYIPWLLFALPSGTLVDRWDRRRLMWLVNTMRGLVMVGLAALVMTNAADFYVLLAAAFLLGWGQTLFDPAAQAILPELIPGSGLRRANARLQSGVIVVGRFVGPSTGTLLYAAYHPSPFAVDAASFLASALLIWSIKGSYQVRQRTPTSTAQALSEGIRWLIGQRDLWRLCVASTVFAFAAAASAAISVVYVLEALRLPGTAYGLLLSLVAVASLVASFAAPRLEGWSGTARTMRLSLTGIGISICTLSITHNRYAAVASFAFSGFCQTVFNVIAVSYRQTVIPRELLGRTSSVFRFLAWGCQPAGAITGGFLAHYLGLSESYAAIGVPPIVAGVVILHRFSGRPSAQQAEFRARQPSGGRHVCGRHRRGQRYA